eukprot:9159312-Lingulodinium_polyedra.AAC.1
MEPANFSRRACHETSQPSEDATDIDALPNIAVANTRLSAHGCLAELGGALPSPELGGKTRFVLAQETDLCRRPSGPRAFGPWPGDSLG